MATKILRDTDGKPLFYQEQMRKCMRVVTFCQAALEKIPARSRTGEQKYALEQAVALDKAYQKYLEEVREDDAKRKV